MPTLLVDDERQQGCALLADADHRDGCVDPGKHAAHDRAALVEHQRRTDAPALEQVDDRRCAAAGCLLVVTEREVDVLGRNEPDPQLVLDGLEDARQRALVVERSTAPDLLFFACATQFGGERRMLPAEVGRGHDVVVRHEHARLGRGPAGPAEQQRVAGDDLALEPPVYERIEFAQRADEPVELFPVSLRLLGAGDGGDSHKGLQPGDRRVGGHSSSLPSVASRLMTEDVAVVASVVVSSWP